MVNSWSLSLLFSGYKSCLFHSIKEHLNLHSYLSLNVWGERKMQGELAKRGWNLISLGCRACIETSFFGNPPCLPPRTHCSTSPQEMYWAECDFNISSHFGKALRVNSHTLVWFAFTGDPLALKKLQLPQRGDGHEQICVVFLLKTVSLHEGSG